MSRVYLAGHITGTTYNEATDWRAYAERRLIEERGIKSMSPMRGKDFLAARGVIPNDNRYADVSPLGTAQGITARDRNDVMTSDAIIMNLTGFDKISIGSMIEIGWADAFRKPVVLIVDPESEVASHVMVQRCVTYIVHNLDDAIDLTIILLGG